MATPPPIIIPAELDDADLTPAAFRVLCHLVRRGAAQERGAWGSIEGMAKSCRMADKPLKIALRQLIDSGWITRTSRPGFTSIYRLSTQSKNDPRVDSTPGSNLPHPPGSNLPHPLGSNLPHEGVTGRSQEKGIPPNPPGGGQMAAELTSELTPNGTDLPSHSTPQKKESGPASEDIIRDIPTALDALAPLLTALGRDPRQRLTSEEEHDLLPILRTPAGLRLSDITALTDLMRQREAVHFTALPDDSPLRSVKRKLGTLLRDWPNQLALATKLTQKKKTSPTAADTAPTWPWQAVCWHLYEGEPLPWADQTHRDRRRYAQTWSTWTEDQRQTAIHRYTQRLTTPIDTELQTA
jgi:hypothetical protein